MSTLITVKIYRDDHAWLQAVQRRLSFEADSFVPMPDVVRMLIENARAAEAQ